MTRFVKSLLIIIIIIGVGVGVKYILDNYDLTKYLPINEKTNVSKEVVDDINEYLNDVSNIGFLEYNYKSLDITKISFDKLYPLFNKSYEWSSDKLILVNYDSSTNYKKFGSSYSNNLIKREVCYNVSKLNQHVQSITNQTLDASHKTICTDNILSEQYIAKISIDKVIKNNDIYSVEYKAYTIDNQLYLQKNPNVSKDTAKYITGTVKLTIIDNRYIFVSNNIKNGSNL